MHPAPGLGHLRRGSRRRRVRTARRHGPRHLERGLRRSYWHHLRQTGHQEEHDAVPVGFDAVPGRCGKSQIQPPPPPPPPQQTLSSCVCACVRACVRWANMFARPGAYVLKTAPTNASVPHRYRRPRSWRRAPSTRCSSCTMRPRRASPTTSKASAKSSHVKRDKIKRQVGFFLISPTQPSGGCMVRADEQTKSN